MIRRDTLDFCIYTRHGDSCNCHPYVGRDPIQCASGHHPDDYVLSAAFSYFQEAIDKAQEWQKRGVSCKIRTKLAGCKPPCTWHNYPAKTPNTEAVYDKV
jgi:hypothetical protein